MAELPEKSGVDVAHALVKAAISAIPVAGGPAAELFALIVAPPIERRRDRWLEEVAKAVEQIQAQVSEITPEKLSENESFVTTLLQATQIASRNHENEKIEALRNAIVRSGLPGAPDETLQRMFLNYVDDLTPWHLRILGFFDNPQEWGRQHGIEFPSAVPSSPADTLEKAMPELVGRRGFYDQITRELENHGLFGGSIHTMMTGHGALSSRTTNFGKEFLSFISRHRN